jgi:hypothetical protein
MEKLSVFGAFRFSEFRIIDCVPVLGEKPDPMPSCPLEIRK